MTAKNDQDLLLSLALGDDSALDHFFKRHSNKVYNYALKRGLNGQQAQDLVQIVFMQIFRKRSQYNPQHAALAWLYVITRSETRDYKRREFQDFTEFDDSLSQTPETPPNNEHKQEVTQLIAELPEKERQIIEDRYLHEMEYEEIARKLNKTESSIRQIVSRTMRLLKKKHAIKPPGKESGGEL